MNITPMDQLPPELQQAIRYGTRVTVCPKCNGGRTHEWSLNIKQIDDVTVSLKCFRASCGWYTRTAGTGKREIDTFRPRPLEDDLKPLSIPVQNWLACTYGLKPSTVVARGWRLLDDDTLAIPLYDPYGRQIGHQTRTLTTPKVCRIYKTVDKPLLDVWDHDNDSPLVIVEDSISAARLFCLGYNACAVLGTNITIAAAKDIALTADGRTVILALDRDAFHKALDLSSRLRHIVRMIPVCLTEDIKDADHDIDIVSLIDGVTSGRAKADGGDLTGSEQL